MNLLLDTHTFLWFAGREEAAKLPQATKNLLEAKRNVVFLSLASVWELTIKASMGKLDLKGSTRALVEFQLNHNNITLLSISLAHLDLLETLPYLHKDPFDRLLVAQSLIEKMPLVSVDVQLDAYGVTRIWN